MIERATGYYTGAVGNDGSLYRGGFLGEFEDPDNGTTILVKTHRPINRATAAVLLIRNPYNAILAEFNRNHGGGHTGHASREDFYDREVWYAKVLDQGKRWKMLYNRYIRSMPAHVIYFEEIKQNLKGTMESILEFLHVDIENFDEVSPLRPH